METTTNTTPPMSEAVLRRYLPIAGPFEQGEEDMLAGVHAFLARTGARVLLVSERQGQTICRLRSECETEDETRQRLASRKRRRAAQPKFSNGADGVPGNGRTGVVSPHSIRATYFPPK